MPETSPDLPVLRAVLFDMDDTLIDWAHFSGDWMTLEKPFLRRVYDFATRPIAVM